MKLKINFDYKKIFPLLTEHAYRILLAFLILACLTIAAVFYFYTYNVKPPAPAGAEVKIKTGIYQTIIQKLNQREANTQQGTEQDYRDIFK